MTTEKVQQSTIVPWALTRLSPVIPVEVNYSPVRLNPVTQTTIYREPSGTLVEPLEAGKHGSIRNTAKQTQRSKDGKDGPRSDSDTNFDSERD